MRQMSKKYKIVSPDILNNEITDVDTYNVINKVIKYYRLDILSKNELDMLQIFLESEGAEFPKKLRDSTIDEEFEEVLIAVTELNVQEYIKFIRKRIVKTRNEKKGKNRIKFYCSYCKKTFGGAIQLKDHILNNHDSKGSKEKSSKATIIGNAILKSYRHKVKKKKKMNKDFTPSEDAIWFRYPGSYESNK